MTISEDFIPLSKLKCDPDKFYRLVTEKNISQRCAEGYRICSEHFHVDKNELACYMCIDRKLYEMRKKVINHARDAYEQYIAEMMGEGVETILTPDQLEQLPKLFKGYPEFKKDLKHLKNELKQFKKRVTR